MEWIKIEFEKHPRLYQKVLLCRKRSFWVGCRGNGTYKNNGQLPTHYCIVDLPEYTIKPSDDD